MKRTRHVILRIAITWLIMAGTLMLLDPIFEGLTVENWGAAFEMAALVGLLNALVWPLFVRW